MGASDASLRSGTIVDTPVVGIGGAAGDTDALRLLLAGLPSDEGLAVVVRHPNPAELAAEAARMPVVMATDGMRIEANHIYVVPENAAATVSGGALVLGRGSATPIDGLLRSLAAECGARGMGVILSGSGVDGVAGAEAMQAAGGITFAQDPKTAFSGTRPAAAIGCTDFVLAPGDIAAELARLGRHPYLAGGDAGRDHENIRRILAIPQASTGVNFSLYRDRMVRGRIRRRMALLGLDEASEYGARLKVDAREVAGLAGDLLIGVTQFFLNPELFRYVRQTILPRLLEGRSRSDSLRIWVAGCATGEEAYTLAILVDEAMREARVRCPVQILASDVSAAAVAKARAGQYLETIAQDLTEERLDRYFRRVGDAYHVDKRLREMCVFTEHNVLEDPPFTRLDLISCRNLLTYLKKQGKWCLIPSFHFGLKAGGYLVLGGTEVVSNELFEAVDGKHRVYAKRVVSRGAAARRLGKARQRGAPEIRREVLSERPFLVGGVIREGLEVRPGKARPALEVEPAIAPLQRQPGEARERLLAAMKDHEVGGAECENTSDGVLPADEEPRSLSQDVGTASAALPWATDGVVTVMEMVRQPLLLLDRELRVKVANPSYCETFQTSPLETEGRVVYEVSQGCWNVAALREGLNRLVEWGGTFGELEVECCLPRLGRRSIALGGGAIRDRGLILLSASDVTEQHLAKHALRKSQEDLRQTQKMEALGRLAGGIAHDFNNLLTVIIGYSNLLGIRLKGEPGIQAQLHEMRTAGERAAALTKQLLAFSRRQVLQPKVFNLNLLVEDFERMLARLMGEQVTVVTVTEPELWHVKADPGEIGRAIMNLSLNGRDAMPGGGTLTVTTSNAMLPESEAKALGLEPGRYVAMAVRDTGKGIPAEAREHIFEPFFTTKEMGKGTGLGLATVVGIVQQSGGAIRCESEPGMGTTFTIFLPYAGEAMKESPEGEIDEQVSAGHETILLVEDEDMVRRLAVQVLSASGYTVHQACNGREGLEFLRAHTGAIDLVVTDVVMPEMGGREFARLAEEARPGLKVLYISGHTQDAMLHAGLAKGMGFLAKPFTPEALAMKVRWSLDAGRRRRKASQS